MTTIHIPPGEGRINPMPDGDHVAKAAVHDAEGSFEVFEVIAPARPMAPPHVSPWTGVLYLLEGRVTALVGGTTYDVEPGGMVVFPAGTPCSFEVVGESARFVGITTGDGRRTVLRRLRRLGAARPTRRGVLGGDLVGHPVATACGSRVRESHALRGDHTCSPDQVAPPRPTSAIGGSRPGRRSTPGPIEVRELGDTWAVARESTPRIAVLGRQPLRLDRPTVIRTTVG